MKSLSTYPNPPQSDHLWERLKADILYQCKKCGFRVLGYPITRDYEIPTCNEVLANKIMNS